MWVCQVVWGHHILPRMTRRKTYAEVVAPVVVEREQPEIRNEPAVTQRPAGPAPWSGNGLLVGERRFGPMVCNPKKSAVVRVVKPDDVMSGPPPPASGCVML